LSKQYHLYEQLLSKPRLGRYQTATQGNKIKAIKLYKYNLRLSQALFGAISMLEIALRNAIDQHYQKQLNQSDWLKDSIQSTGLFYDPTLKNKIGRFEQAEKVKSTINAVGKNYSHDRVVAGLSFGFWRFMFSGIQFRAFGDTLLRIFPNRPKGINQKNIYQKLTEINNLRNRIAHHEPICFDSNNNPSVQYSQTHYQDILDLLEWLDYPATQVLDSLESPKKDWKNIQKL
jgi:Abi-like protein